MQDVLEIQVAPLSPACGARITGACVLLDAQGRPTSAVSPDQLHFSGAAVSSWRHCWLRKSVFSSAAKMRHRKRSVELHPAAPAGSPLVPPSATPTCLCASLHRRVKRTPDWGRPGSWEQAVSVVLDGADDEEDETEDRRAAEGEDRAGGAAGAVDSGGLVATVRSSPESDLRLEKQLQEQAALAFDPGVGRHAEADREREIEKLHVKIGQLTVERDPRVKRGTSFLARRSGR